MTKIMLAPNQASYAVQPSTDEYLRTQLDGGAGRYRRDILNATILVNVSWTVPSIGFDYLHAVHNVWVNRIEPFTIDLFINEEGFSNVLAWFVPGTFKYIESVRGQTYTVTAQLEIQPIERDLELDEDLLALWEEFEEDWPYYLDQLQIIVNDMWPEGMPYNYWPKNLNCDKILKEFYNG